MVAESTDSSEVSLSEDISSTTLSVIISTRKSSSSGKITFIDNDGNTVFLNLPFLQNVISYWPSLFCEYTIFVPNALKSDTFTVAPPSVSVSVGAILSIGAGCIGSIGVTSELALVFWIDVLGLAS